MPVVAGVDCSTQSTKVELRDLDTGALLGTGSAPHPPTTPPRSEQHPSAWEAAMHQALHEALGQAALPGMDGLSVAGQQHGMVLLDRSGDVLRPAKLWNDTESAPQAARLVEQLGAEQWARRSGSVPTAAFTVTKLAWLREQEPEVYERVSRVLLPHDWLTFRLTGQLVTDRGDASGTGYWSPATGSWDARLLELVDAERDWAGALPLVLGPTGSAGMASRVLGRPLVGVGTGDNMAAALGLGLRTGDVAVSIGTSGTVYTVASTPAADPSGAVAGFADATGRWLPLVCTLNATKVTDAVRRLLGVDPGQLDALALEGRSRGLVLLPYLDGERTPDRPAATGVLAGVRSDVSREQLARAAVEGVVCGLLDGLDALTRVGVRLSGTLRVVGGGARSAAYCQVLADLTGRALVPVAGETVATGAAVQAAAVLAGAPPDEVLASWKLGATHLTVEPQRSTAEAAEIRQRYAELRESTAVSG